jgi:hypothetical protein
MVAPFMQQQLADLLYQQIVELALAIKQQVVDLDQILSIESLQFLLKFMQRQLTVYLFQAIVEVVLQIELL